jgi:hypothetical protein
MEDAGSVPIADIFDVDDEDPPGTISSTRGLKVSHNRGISTKQNMPYFRVAINQQIKSGIETPTDPQPQESARGHAINAIRETGISNLDMSNTIDEVTMKSVKHICYECRRKFRDSEHLLRHQRLSMRHRNRIAQ